MHSGYNPKEDGKDIKDMFRKYYGDMKFDKHLASKLKVFRLGWVQKGEDYSDFLGSNLLGVHPIRFSSRDDELLMTDVFNIDASIIRTSLKRLPGVSPTWAVATNPILQTLLYTIHMYTRSSLSEKAKEDAIRDCFHIFSYKVFGGLIYAYFKKYTPSVDVAKATYEKLSNRFLIKQLGTWNDVIEHRASTVLPHGSQYKRIKNYDTPDAVRVCNDTQGAIRKTILEIYGVMVNITVSGEGISSASLEETIGDGEAKNKALTERPDKYIHRLEGIIGNPTALLNDDVIYLVSNLVKASDTGVMSKSLIALSDEYNPKHKNAKYAENIILKTIAYAHSKGIRSEYRDNLLEIVKHMTGYWSSGSVSDPEVKATKEYLSSVVKKATGRKTGWVVAANTTGLIVYLFIMAIK